MEHNYIEEHHSGSISDNRHEYDYGGGHSGNSYDYDYGWGGEAYIVPEPSVAILLVLGFIAMGFADFARKVRHG